jgi:hypothetical protein
VVAELGATGAVVAELGATGAGVAELRATDSETICCWKAGTGTLGNEAAGGVSAVTANFGAELMDYGVSTDQGGLVTNGETTAKCELVVSGEVHGRSTNFGKPKKFLDIKRQAKATEHGRGEQPDEGAVKIVARIDLGEKTWRNFRSDFVKKWRPVETQRAMAHHGSWDLTNQMQRRKRVKLDSFCDFADDMEDKIELRSSKSIYEKL